MESEYQTETRRAISAWLTEQMNTVSAVGNAAPLSSAAVIRSDVLAALADIRHRIIELNADLQSKYHVRPDRMMARFYMKGGNAFKCIINPNGADATRNGGGTSDWDTQAIVTPWAPLPLQAIIYGLVEELVTDALIKAGAEIALVADDFVNEIMQRWNNQRQAIGPKAINCSAYVLAYEKPQTLRHVFDHERLGLWTNDRRPVSNPGDVPSRGSIPGILLNDAIPHFVLYRLGYVWHVNPDPTFVGDRPESIQKPALMELIDVTLPRQDTIEAVAVWEALERGQIGLTPTRVTVNQGAINDGETLPLPDLLYHLREIATMLCEIADGSSRHADKLSRRLERFHTICHAGVLQTVQIQTAISALAGVAILSVEARTAPNMDISSKIAALCPEALANQVLNGHDPAYFLALNLMDTIANAAQAAPADFADNGSITRTSLISCDQARIAIGELCKTAVRQLPQELESRVRTAAFSDDLAMLRFIEENDYIDPAAIGFSTVKEAALIRVADDVTLDALATLLKRQLLARSPGQATVRERVHSTPRATSFTREVTLVAFEDGKARSYVSLTTATDAELPFRPDPENPNCLVAPMTAIATQRKIAAALIEDYQIGTEISRQYEALKNLLPVI